MSYANQNLQQVLARCHYDQNTKNYLYNEQMHILHNYQMSYKPVSAKLPSGSFTILEVFGTIPVPFKGNTYNIPIKIHYLPGYPSGPPVLIVNPSPEMMIKTSENVRQDGKANFRILNEWTRNYNTLMVLDEAKRIFSADMPVFKKPKNPMPQGASGYSSVQPRPSSSHPGSNPNNGVGAPNLSQPGYQSVQPNPVSSYPPVVPGYSTLATGYSSVPTTQNPGYVAQPESRVPVQNPIPPPNNSKSIDLEKIKKVYKLTIDSLSSEISVLKTESQTLSSNSSLITASLDSFKSEIQSCESKLDLIKANIKNTEDWISLSSSSNLSEINYEDLIEFRNNEAKFYLELTSQERSLESTIQVIIEGLQKSIIPAKESLLLLKQLYIDLFLITRLKEKSKKSSLQSN